MSIDKDLLDRLMEGRSSGDLFAPFLALGFNVSGFFLRHQQCFL